ncbi:hypothetical protein LEP1GSC044_1998 [Leptospira kirschneri serovar Grippotyphosa str. RM52]|nr:hypothetical protein LEP1GSC044_1998 [Leptospira kirschneri serovar Grippotyphosa str. RM52]EKR07113.1 hypothetical protein LEP1GSC122_3510 [Leptospira kirschneri serovar Valbuzzi str. 200702274]EMK06741.1 hypothetical protein LEP1GSC176_3786 [Leptospira kirschneri str. MMD1493]OOV49347.1 hypothetical protein B1J94_07015 [Leptospira kirschneri serovar Grippotyphosa]
MNSFKKILKVISYYNRIVEKISIYNDFIIRFIKKHHRISTFQAKIKYFEIDSTNLKIVFKSKIL